MNDHIINYFLGFRVVALWKGFCLFIVAIAMFLVVAAELHVAKSLLFLWEADQMNN